MLHAPQDGYSSAAIHNFYRRAMQTLQQNDLPFLVGGGYAFELYTDVARKTKDIDLFVLPNDVQRVLKLLERCGYRTSLRADHWLAKVADDTGEFIDIIFNSGNGICPVDDDWFHYARPVQLLGLSVKLCPIEEILWQKAFIMERARYDGADVAHLLRAHGSQLDWERLLRRFGDYWRVLLSHLILFGFIYPQHRDSIPNQVLETLLQRLHDEMQQSPDANGQCRGTLLSLFQYRVDVDEWGLHDARLAPDGNLSAKQLEQWHRAAESEL